jgi:hypothetical protein
VLNIAIGLAALFVVVGLATGRGGIVIGLIFLAALCYLIGKFVRRMILRC